MNPRLFDAALKRERLIERSGAQRERLALHAQGLRAVCAQGDRAASMARKVRDNPKWVLLATAALVIIRPRRAWRLAKTAFVLWRVWNTIRRKLPIAVPR